MTHPPVSRQPAPLQPAPLARKFGFPVALAQNLDAAMQIGDVTIVYGQAAREVRTTVPCPYCRAPMITCDVPVYGRALTESDHQGRYLLDRTPIGMLPYGCQPCKAVFWTDVNYARGEGVWR